MPISGNLRVEVEFDRALFRRGGSRDEERTLRIEGAAAGGGGVCVGGSAYVVRYGPAGAWAGDAEGESGWTFRGSANLLSFPLEIRGWRDGDRMRTERGRRSLKKVFLEQRIPRERRRRLPLLVDAKGEVIWVAGVTGSASDGAGSFILQVLHD